MKPDKSHAHAERLWAEAIEVVRRAPQTMLALEFEEKVFLLFSLIGVAIDEQTICVAYHSALSGEDLEWLKSRLDHELSKAS